MRDLHIVTNLNATFSMDKGLLFNRDVVTDGKAVGMNNGDAWVNRYRNAAGL